MPKSIYIHMYIVKQFWGSVAFQIQSLYNCEFSNNLLNQKYPRYNMYVERQAKEMLVQVKTRKKSLTKARITATFVKTESG